jgi:ABC-type uncharacterized transport system permease subunit
VIGVALAASVTAVALSLWAWHASLKRYTSASS